MKRHIGRSWKVLRTTAIGGLLFLFPLMVIGALLGYVYNIVIAIYEPLRELIPVDTATGVALLFMIAVLILLLMCFICGLLARRAIARKFSRTIEKQLMTVFPKYTVYKDLIAGNIGGDEHAPTLLPVSVRFDDYCRLAFEAERLSDGRVVVYLPGAPDAWSGCVVLVADDRVERLDIAWPEVVGVFERLGRECAHLPVGGVSSQNGIQRPTADAGTV